MGNFTDNLAAKMREPLPTWLRPRDNWVLVEECDESVSPAGLVMPETAKDGREFLTCKVLAVGPGVLTESAKRVPIDLEQGEMVIARKLTMEQTQGMGPRHVMKAATDRQYLIEASFILAVIEDGAAPWEVS